jgi:Asp-tRNA(Asn)/Glu-tRNA(Gln) amidotransferase A subunit family amidase
VGFKPTHGLVPMDGCFPLAPSFDTVGPMARDVGTCVELAGALAPGMRPEPLGSLAELRVAVAGLEWEGFERVEPPSATGVQASFMREVAVTHDRIFAEHRALYGANVAAKVERCLAVTDAEYERANARRAELRDGYAALLRRYDLLLTPTVPIAPPAVDVDELEVRETAISHTFPLNAIGAPALALPHRAAGPGGSLQVIAAPGRDALVLAAAELLEARA